MRTTARGAAAGAVRIAPVKPSAAIEAQASIVRWRAGRRYAARGAINAGEI